MKLSTEQIENLERIANLLDKNIERDAEILENLAQLFDKSINKNLENLRALFPKEKELIDYDMIYTTKSGGPLK